MQQFELLSAESAVKRVSYEIKNAQLIDEQDDQSRAVESIHALINSVQQGDRELREQATTPYEYSRLDEFYDMVATTDSESKLTVERVLESQKKDPF
jgi:hypothetical protein